MRPFRTYRIQSAARSGGPREFRTLQAAIEAAWHRDLVALLAEGGSRGEFRRVDADRFATRLRALPDGFSVHVAVGPPGTSRAQALESVAEFVDETLIPPTDVTRP